MTETLTQKMAYWIKQSEIEQKFPTTIATQDLGIARIDEDFAITERKLFDMFIDEINNNYVLRPRDNKGIPFNEGDTVWSTDPSTQYSAKIIEVVGNVIKIQWEDGITDFYDQADLTHERPDSLDRIKADRKLSCIDYHNKYHSETLDKTKDEHLLERAIALLEKEEQ